MLRKLIGWNYLLTVTLVSGLCMVALPADEAAAQENQSGEVAGQEVTVLFDGSDLDQWRGYSQKKIGSGWSIDGDALHCDGSGTGDIITKATYADFVLYFDWKISEGGNSGVMYRVSLGDNAPYYSGPEYQVLDSAGREGDYRRTDAAALYGLYAPQGAHPKPAGEWNSAKIVLRGHHIEHWLNGERVVSAEIGSEDWKERVANSKFNAWEKFAKNRSGYIALQDHGNKVWYKDIRIKELKDDAGSSSGQ